MFPATSRREVGSGTPGPVLSCVMHRLPFLLRSRLPSHPQPVVLLFGALFVLSLLPILVVDIPAGADTPNHLARMGVLSREAADEHPYYDVRWGVSANLAMDLVVPAVASVLGVEAATKFFYLTAQVLVVTGAVALELVQKRRFGIAGFVALGLLYSVPFAWGFVNFMLGCGIALWGIAVHGRYQDRSPRSRVAVHTLLVTLLFFAHFFALGVYGFTVGLIELWRWLHSERDRRQLLWTAGWLAAPLVLLLGLMWLAGGAVGSEGTDWAFALKLVWVVMAANGYSWLLAFGLSLAALVTTYLVARHGGLRVHGPGWWVIGGLTGLFLVMPFKLFDVAFVDVRVVVGALLVIPSFVSVRIASRLWRRVTAVVAVSLILINLSYVTHVQLTSNRWYDQVIASTEHIEPGSRVLVGITHDMGDPPRRLADYTLYHAPTLAVHYRDAFVPTLFTTPGSQPIRPKASLRHLDVPYGAPIPVTTLRAVAEGQPAETVKLRSYAANWTRDYDYLYVLGEPEGNPMPALLADVANGDQFALYRIRR